MDISDGYRDGAGRGLPAAKLDQVLALIDERLGQSLSLRELADCARMSQFHFARKFRLSTGHSPHAFLTRRRMERAKSLLRETDLPLAQVGRRVGYQTQAHFTGVFRRHVGLTPRVFRRQPEPAMVPVEIGEAFAAPAVALRVPAERMMEPLSQE
jgi:AraC-like DNA-binding protein